MKIKSVLHIPGHTVLSFDAPLPKKRDKVRIENRIYKTEIVYDMPNSIGIIGKVDAAGKEAEFL